MAGASHGAPNDKGDLRVALFPSWKRVFVAARQCLSKRAPARQPSSALPASAAIPPSTVRKAREPAPPSTHRS